MDEATASVDTERDEAIHEIVRSGLQGYTVLSIAHRLHTLHMSDWVLVLDRGVVAEFAPPRELLACLAGLPANSYGDPGLETAAAGLSRLAGLVLSLGPQEAARIVSMVGDGQNRLITVNAFRRVDGRRPKLSDRRTSDRSQNNAKRTVSPTMTSY